MGHTIQVRGDTAWIIFKKGRVTLEGWLSAFDALLSDPKFRPGMPCLWDVRGASQESLSSHALATIARITAERRHERGEGRTAVMVARDVDFAAARVYQQKYEESVSAHFRPFRDLDKAEEWLRARSDQADTDAIA